MLCILHQSKRSKEAMASTDLISESRSQASYSSFKVLRRLLHTCTLLFILVMPFNMSIKCSVPWRTACGSNHHCAKNRIYAIVYFAYISSIRTNIRVRIREISHWYILRIEPISHCVYFEYPQMYHVRYGGFSN